MVDSFDITVYTEPVKGPVSVRMDPALATAFKPHFTFCICAHLQSFTKRWLIAKLSSVNIYREDMEYQRRVLQ